MYHIMCYKISLVLGQNGRLGLFVKYKYTGSVLISAKYTKSLTLVARIRLA
jgi:hypothetical protein